MKLQGVTDGKFFIASVARHHYVVKGDLMADGGQPTLQYSGGYTRFRGKWVWAEVRENFGDLYTAYERGEDVGIWQVGNIWNNYPDRALILEKKEVPNTKSKLWKYRNFIWGSRGKNGDEPLKYVNLSQVSVEHLNNIKKYLLEIGAVKCEAMKIVNFYLEAWKEDEGDKI